jgi:hypothetical protein
MEADFDRRVDEEIDRRRDVEMENMNWEMDKQCL